MQISSGAIMIPSKTVLFRAFHKYQYISEWVSWRKNLRYLLHLPPYHQPATWFLTEKLDTLTPTIAPKKFQTQDAILPKQNAWSRNSTLDFMLQNQFNADCMPNLHKTESKGNLCLNKCIENKEIFKGNLACQISLKTNEKLAWLINKQKDDFIAKKPDWFDLQIILSSSIMRTGFINLHNNFVWNPLSQHI